MFFSYPILEQSLLLLFLSISSPLRGAGDLDLSPFFSRIDSFQLKAIAPVTGLETCLCTPNEEELPAWENIPWAVGLQYRGGWSGCECDRVAFASQGQLLFHGHIWKKTSLRVGTSADLWFSLLLQAKWPDYCGISALENHKTYPPLSPLPIWISAQLFSGCKSLLWIQSVPLTSSYSQCLPTVHCCGENASIYWVTSKVLRVSW